MLSLSRKKDQTIVIGNGEGRVVIAVAKVSRGRVQLHIEASRSTRIVRGEIDDLPPNVGPVIDPNPQPAVGP